MCDLLGSKKAFHMNDQQRPKLLITLPATRDLKAPSSYLILSNQEFREPMTSRVHLSHNITARTTPLTRPIPLLNQNIPRYSSYHRYHDRLGAVLTAIFGFLALMEVFVYAGYDFLGAKAVRFPLTDKVVGLEGCAHF